jgi:ribosomal protein S18 acetylase RimI-like enzyme
MIRPAKPEDARFIAELMIHAMKELAMQFRNSDKIEDCIALFQYFCTLDHNQYSYQNTLVYVENNEIIGSITAYDGALLKTLRLPFFNYIKKYHDNADFIMEEESAAGEFYLDTISIKPGHRGKGLGQLLIKAAIAWAKQLGHQKVGLLVDKENPAAKRLYERLGFVLEGEKVLLGKPHEHLVYSLPT